MHVARANAPSRRAPLKIHTRACRVPDAVRTRPTLSLVVPVYNEIAVLERFVQEVESALQSLDCTYEYVFVDDGSDDGTAGELVRIQQRIERVAIVTLSRNFGKEAALTAGLRYAQGEAVVPIDCDLQDPPQVIPALVDRWREGFQVVDAVRRDRSSDTFFKRTSAALFYKLMRRISSAPMVAGAGDFRLLDRIAVEAVLSFGERIRVMKALMADIGFARAVVYYDRAPRSAGKTKWNYRELWALALDAVTGYSTLPLRIWTYVGVAVAGWSVLYVAWTAAKHVIFGTDPPGYATMLSVTLLLGGVQLIGLGIIGEYVGRAVVEVKARPLYLVRSVRPYRRRNALPVALTEPAKSKQ